MVGAELQRAVGRVVLMRALAAVIAAAMFVVLGSGSPASASEGENCRTERDPVTNEVKIICQEDNDEDGEPDSGSSTCSYEGNEIPCTGPVGSVWSSRYACWIGARGPYDMAPPEGQTEEDGWWHVCYFPPPGSSWEYMWIETGEVGIDPVTLANRAIASMDLDPITIGIVPESGPDRVGLVGMPVWMWVANRTENTYGPITRSASEGSVSVSATASVSSIVWDMGDGSKVTCTGPGTRYAAHYGKQDSPTCGHRYEKMSSGQPENASPVTATSRWVIEWNGGGQTGTIELNLVSDPLPIRVGEVQVLTQ